MRTSRLAIWAILAALASTSAAFAQNGPIAGTTFSSSGRPAAGVNIAVCSTLTTTAAAVTSNIATLTFSSNPQSQGFTIGFPLVVSGFSGADTYFNGTFTIAAVSSSTISYAITHANASATSNGTVYMTGSTVQACAPLTSNFTDHTGSFSTPNPFTSDGLGNYLTWTAPGYYEVQFYGPTVTTMVNLVAVPCVVSSSCGGGGGGGGTPGGSSGQLQWNSAGSFAGVAGSVAASTGAVTLTAGADSTTPLALASHSVTQSVSVLDVNHQSSGTADTPFVVRGRGMGSFTPAAFKGLAHLIQESDAFAHGALIITNHTADVAKGAANYSLLTMGVNDSGLAQIAGGATVADGGNNYWCLQGDANESLFASQCNPTTGAAIVPFYVKAANSQSADIFEIRNSSNVAMSGFDANGNLLFNGTSGTAKLGVAAAAGTPNQINLPTSTGTSGSVLTTDGNNPQQSSWALPSAFECTYQGPQAPVTGTGSAATYYTCSVPALAAGNGISITAVAKHTTGTANITYSVTFGGTSTTTSTQSGSANQIEVIKCLLMNNPGSTSAQTVTTQFNDSNAANLLAVVNTMAINTTTSQTLNIQFNVANTDAITPEMFTVQLVR